MWYLKACTVCFRTNVKLFLMDIDNLRHEYNLISGLKTHVGDGLPEYLCVECRAYLKSYKKFRDKCHRAHYALKEILNRNKEVTISALEAINYKSIATTPSLSYLDLNKAHYEEAKFLWTRHNRLYIFKDQDIPIKHYSTLNEETIFDVPPKQAEVTNNVKVETGENNDLLLEFENYDDKHTAFEEPACNNEEVNNVDNYFNDDNDCESISVENDDDNECNLDDKDNDETADGSNLEEEYANIYPISLTEAKAAIEVYKMFSSGKFTCSVCGKGYHNENRLKIHLRMHDKHVSGGFYCELCKYYYKTEFLLRTHMTEKHMFKYICKKCPEVSFDRTSAKQHYIWTHLQEGKKKNLNWYESRPSWLRARGGRRVKGVVTLRPVKKMHETPDDFPTYTPLKQEEQYSLVLDRRNTKNYMDADYKCNLCFRGFRELLPYNKHMRKHDPAISGPLQCDMCKLQLKNTRKMYKHMSTTHLFKYSCKSCSYVCYSRAQAQMHYRWHKNVKYTCPHCKKEFMKASTRLTHIRIKHPSTNICNLCGHSYVSENGLYCHKKLAHTKEEIQLSESLVSNLEDPFYCSDCQMQFLNEAAFTTHLGSSSKHAVTNLSVKGKFRGAGAERRTRGRPRRTPSSIVNTGLPTANNCELCGKYLSTDAQASKHYDTEHPGTPFPKRYMCDVCGHTTRQYANLMVHMRTHTQDKPYECPHCRRRFSMASNRDRHIFVHTGEKRYQCQHCNRRFTQSSAVKLHIQTVHLKIPYAPWDKKNRKRRKEQEATNTMLAAAVNPSTAAPPPTHKLLLETQGDYLNAYITYQDE